MADKTYILLLIVMILAGAYSYDRYLVQKGEISPLARMVDFAGLSDFSKEKESTIKLRRKKFQYSLEENYTRFEDKLVEIHERKNELFEKRDEIVRRIMELNGELEEEALEYANVINAERNQFLEKFSNIGDEIDATLKKAKGGAEETAEGNLDPEDLQEVMQLTQKLNLSYQDFLSESQGQVELMKENDERVAGEFKQLVAQLVKTTESDVRDIMNLFTEIQQEQQLWMDYLENDLDQLVESQEEFSSTLHAAMKNSQSDTLKQKLFEFHKEHQSFLEQSKQNEHFLKETINRRWEVKEEFLDKAAALAGVNLKRLMEDNAYAQDQMALYMKNRQAFFEQKYLGDSDDFEDETQMRTENNEAQLKLIREKIHDQGHF